MRTGVTSERARARSTSHVCEWTLLATINDAEDFVSYMIAANVVLKRVKSWVWIVESGSGSGASLLILALYRKNYATERAATMFLWLVLRTVHAWPTGSQINSTLTQYCFRAATRGKSFGVFLASFSLHPKSQENPISAMMVDDGRVRGGGCLVLL